MHTIDKKQQFIELRVEGVSLAQIGEKLQVPKSTLWHWNQEEEEHIRRLQLINQDELEAEWLQSREERIDDLHEITMHCHRRLISYFRQHAEHLSPKDLFLYLNLTRSELDHYRLKPLELKAEPEAPQSKMVRNGTISPQNGTPVPEPSPGCGRPGRSNVQDHQRDQTLPKCYDESPMPPLPRSNSSHKPAHGSETVQNGTISPQNVTATPAVASLVLVPSKETEKNGTTLPENGTPQCNGECNSITPHQPSEIHPHASAPAQDDMPSGQMVQNGTISVQNGTAAQQISSLGFGPFPGETEQNGTAFPENGAPQCNRECNSIAPNSPADEKDMNSQT